GPIRGTPLYEAGKDLQRFYPGRKLPVIAWKWWSRLIHRTDNGKGEADPVERTIVCYEIADKLKRWAERRLKAAPDRQPLRVGKATINARMLDTLSRVPESKNWSKARWAEHLDCSLTGIQTAPVWDKVMQDREESKRQRQNR